MVHQPNDNFEGINPPKQTQTYSESDMINFGNFLLCPQRMKRIKKRYKGTDFENEKFEHKVHHADLQNWKDEKNNLTKN